MPLWNLSPREQVNSYVVGNTCNIPRCTIECTRIKRSSVTFPASYVTLRGAHPLSCHLFIVFVCPVDVSQHLHVISSPSICWVVEKTYSQVISCEWEIYKCTAWLILSISICFCALITWDYGVFYASWVVSFFQQYAWGCGHKRPWLEHIIVLNFSRNWIEFGPTFVCWLLLQYTKSRMTVKTLTWIQHGSQQTCHH